MHILVLLKMVPDVVEDLEVAPDGRALDMDYLRLIPNESDDHALEQALLLKERHGARVTVVALDAAEVDAALYTALAKGVDRALKITGADPRLSTRQAARIISQAIPRVPGLMPADLILTGVQAIDDLDGLIAPLVAHELDLPFVGIVTGITLDAAGKTALVMKELSGGVRGEFEVTLPVVLGIQAAEKPPRYVPVAKVRAATKSQPIDCTPVPTLADGGWPAVEITEMKHNEPAGHAQLLEGDPDQISEQLCEVLAAHGIV